MARAGKAAAVGFTAVYGVILFYVAFQAFWLIKQRHRKTSFKMGFNVLTMLWCVLPRRAFQRSALCTPSRCRSLLRILDWVSSYDDEFNPAGFWYSLVHYFPQAVQFATFGLLAVFWAKVRFPQNCVHRIVDWHRSPCRSFTDPNGVQHISFPFERCTASFLLA